MAEHQKDGGAAFPVPMSEQTCINQHMEPYQTGMTLRDYIATHALAAIVAKLPLFDRQGEHGIAAPTIEEIHGIRLEVARSAYDYADAMLAASEAPR